MNSKEKEISKIIMCIMAISLIIGLKTQGGIPSRRNEVQDKTSFSNSDVIYVDDLKDISREQENIASEIVKLTKKEDFIRQYDNDIYVEDYLDVKERLDKEFSKHLEEKFEKDLNRDFVVIADMEYYNPTLKQAKEENWTLEDILKEPTKHVRTFEFDFYRYIGSIERVPDEIRSNIRNEDIYMDELYEEYDKKGYKTLNMNTYNMRKNISEIDFENGKINIDEIEMLQEASSKGGSLITGDDMKKIKESLEKKYNLEFEFKTSKATNEYAENQFILKSNPEIRFDTKNPGIFNSENIGLIDKYPDKFLTAMAQNYMYDLIYEMLKEEGAEDYVIPITIPFDTDYDDTDKEIYDFSKIKTREDIIKFLNEGYLGDYVTTLIYLKEPSKEINYKMIKKVSEKVMDLVGIDPNCKIEGAGKRIKLYVEYYEIDKDKRERVKYLFEKNKTCSAIYREEINLGNLYKLTSMTREETEGFHYLDIFANKITDYLTLVWRESEEIKNMTLEEFIEKTDREEKY